MKNRVIEIAVTDLATRLDEARLAANDIEETAPQSGVYGDISDALRKTLAVLLDGDHVRADAVYEAILDGSTVKEALAIEAKAHANAVQSESVADRVRQALDTLARHGVTEEQVRSRSGLNGGRWAELTTAETIDVAHISSYELAGLADALVASPLHLLNGDRTVSYSTSTLTAMIKAKYPVAG